MRLVEIKGERNGKINVVNTGNILTSIPISSYNDSLLSVVTVELSTNNLLFYSPKSSNNQFSFFGPQKQYIIFATNSFTLSVNDEFEDKLVFPSPSGAKTFFAQYPFLNFYPLSVFDDKIENNFFYSSLENGMLLFFDKQSSHKSFSGIRQDQTIVFNSLSSFVIYNYELSALKQETYAKAEWILLENGIDRILL